MILIEVLINFLLVVLAISVSIYILGARRK